MGNYPWGIAFDGTNIWVTNMFGNSVTGFQAVLPAVDFDLPGPGVAATKALAV